MHKSSRLFNKQCLVPLCVLCPSCCWWVIGGATFLSACSHLPQSTVDASSPQPALCEPSITREQECILLGSLWVGPPSACPAAMAAILGREVPQLWAGAHHWVVWAGTLWAGTSRCLLSWVDIWPRKVEKLETAEPDMPAGVQSSASRLSCHQGGWSFCSPHKCPTCLGCGKSGVMSSTCPFSC